jgi:hypothetical protein
MREANFCDFADAPCEDPDAAETEAIRRLLSCPPFARAEFPKCF